jgi:hypothetical protein
VQLLLRVVLYSAVRCVAVFTSSSRCVQATWVATVDRMMCAWSIPSKARRNSCLLCAPVQVASSGKTSKMRNFKDPSLRNGIFLLELVAACEPRAVDFDVVKR